jgi:glycosyltransferase involved in cell wall biosynthesis
MQHKGVVVPEGIDLSIVDRAITLVQERRGELPVLRELTAALPSERHGLPLVVTVGRLNPIKGMARVVADWAGDPLLSSSTNLVVVGGDLRRPSPGEQAVLDEIDAVLTSHPRARAGVVLLGARPRHETAQVVAAAHLGAPGVIAPHGAYVNGAAKEEFGLALLEALATGLPVVAPSVGGPSTYVDHGVNGVLVGPTEPMAPAMIAALAMSGDPRRAERARAAIDRNYTIDAMADALVTAYTPLASVTR